MFKYRVAIGGVAQETNSFTGIPTTMADFTGRGGELVLGNSIVPSHRNVNSVMGGFIEYLERHDLAPVPTVAARACPGGPLDKATYESLRDDLLRGLDTASYDGVLLSLHGAMVAEGYDDPEGDILEHVRRIVGDRPIAVVLDLHANLSRTTVQYSDVIIAYKTYPHVDMAASGFKAAELLHSILAKKMQLWASFCPLPMLIPSINMRTNEGVGPMSRLQQLAATLAASDEHIKEIGIYGGFPYADVPCSHASVLTYSSQGQSHADEIRNAIAERYWEERQNFFKATMPAADAIREALQSTERPTVLADIADNPGSGGTGDTTGLLHLVLEHQPANTFVGILHDPATVARAFEIGEGRTSTFEIGGKINPNHGSPVVVEATVERLSDGRYVCSGPMMHGKEEVLGQSALLRAGTVLIGVTEGRASVNDPEMIRMLGVEPTELNLMVLKVKGHFRAAFGDIARQIFDAESPGASMTDFTQLTFHKLRHPIFPFESPAEWRSCE